VSISEVCRATQLSPRTVRYYEEVGLLPGVRRREGGRRAYGPEQVQRLRFIQRLKALGLSLAEIKELNAIYAIGESTRAMLEHLDGLLGRRLRELDGRIAELRSLREDMGAYREHVRARAAGLEVDPGPDPDPGAEPGCGRASQAPRASRGDTP